MTSGHLITYGELPLLGDINTDHLINGILEVRVSLLCEDIDVNYDTGLTVRYMEGSISYFTCTVTEDGSVESLLSRGISLTLRRYLTDEDITGLDLCTDTDDSVLVEVSKSIVTYVRNFSCDLLGTELGISCLADAPKAERRPRSCNLPRS